MKKKNWIILAIVAIVVVAGVYFIPQLMKPGQASADSANLGSVVTVENAVNVESSGEFQVHPYANMTWATSGTVGEIKVKAGDHVKADQVLMTLKTTSVSSSILSAKAQLIDAQKKLDDLLKSDTTRANAWIALRDAEDTLENAQDYRDSLDDEIKGERVKITTVNTPAGQKKIPSIVKYKYNADAETIATADADLALAKAKYEDAKRAYERVKDGANTDDLAAAQATVDASQAVVNTMSITAPFDGEVLYVQSNTGEVVNTGSAAVILADTDHYYVEAQIDEADIAKIQTGQTVEITNDGMPGVIFTGKVDAINPIGTDISGLIKFTVRIALDPADQPIYPGATANVKVQISDVSAHLVVPLAAIQNGSAGEYVTVQSANGAQHDVAIVAGELVDEGVIVSGDLQAGDQVILVSSGMNLPNPMSN
jgi:HlyD family secretion protein